MGKDRGGWRKVWEGGKGLPSEERMTREQNFETLKGITLRGKVIEGLVKLRIVLEGLGGRG